MKRYHGQHTEQTVGLNRRKFLKMACVLSVLPAAPAMAQQTLDLFKLLDPENKNKDIQKARQIFQGAGSVMTSSTELDYQSEFTIGESLALEGFQRYGLPVDNPGLQRYVNFVGRAVARNSMRPKIPYYFVVVQSDLYNAFSCPGGIIFLSAALMKNMGDEAELAGVLAHEVAHVGHKHALQIIRRAQFFEGVTKITTATMNKDRGKKFDDMINDLQDRLFDRGLDQNMELEADLSGMDIAYRAGYDPMAMVRVLQMLQARENSASHSGSWYATHPPLSLRLQRCMGKSRAFPDAAHLATVASRFEKYRRQL